MKGHKELIRLFNKEFNDTYDVEFEKDDSSDKVVTLRVGRTYDSCEHERLEESVRDTLAKFNLKHIGKIFGTSSLLGGDKNVYVMFMEYKDIPQSELNYLKYAYENYPEHIGFDGMQVKVYKKYLEIVG